MEPLELTRQINAARHGGEVKTEQECVGSLADAQRAASHGHRQNKSITAAHPAIYLNTSSHKLLRRAIRIWKMPVRILNCTDSSKPKPRNFQEQLKQVEMLRKWSGVSGTLKPMARSVRDLQLSSGTDSSPSPSTSSDTPCRRTARVHRTRRYRKQLQWYRMLSKNKRCKQGDEKPHRLEGQSSPAVSGCVKGSKYQGDRRDNPVIQTPARKTSRRLWRRKLDSSSSDSSPMTSSPGNKRPDSSPMTSSPGNKRPDSSPMTSSPGNKRPDSSPMTSSPGNKRPDSSPMTSSPGNKRPDSSPMTSSPGNKRPDSSPMTSSPGNKRPDSSPMTSSPGNKRPDSSPMTSSPGNKRPDSSPMTSSPGNKRPDSSPMTSSPGNKRPDSSPMTSSPGNKRPDSSPMTSSPGNKRPDTPATHRSKNTRVSFSFPDESKTSDCSWIELYLLDIKSNLSKEASAYEQKNVDDQDSSDLQTNEKLTPQTSQKCSQHASSFSQLKISKDELKHCEDVSLQIRTPSGHTQSHPALDAPRRTSCVKWKSVLLQRALYEAQCPAHGSWSRFTLAVSAPEGGSDADRPDESSEKPQGSAEDHVENSSEGDSLRPH